MLKWILVAGSARSSDTEALRRAHLVGRSLARSGFGLVVGTWPGVDTVAADAFLSEQSMRGVNPEDCFRQIRDPYWKKAKLLAVASL